MMKIILGIILLAVVIAAPRRNKRDQEEETFPTRQPTGGFLSRFLTNYLRRRLARLVDRNQERRTPLMKLVYDFLAAKIYAQGRNETILIPTLEPTTPSFEDIMAKLSMEILRKDAERQGKKKKKKNN